MLPYTYDLAGNRTQKDAPAAITYYAWDDDGRLASAEPPSGVITFTYNAEDKRVKKATPVDTIGFYYDQNRLLMELDAAGDTDLFFTSTTDEYGDLLSEYDGADSSYHTYDALGSTDSLLDDSQSATDRYAYRAFGQQESHTGSSTSPFTFVGQQNYYKDEELDLYYAGLRHHDPTTGQWTSKDPIGIQANDPNYYRYVGNNPVNKMDPSGLGMDPTWPRLSQDDIERIAAERGLVWWWPVQPTNGPADAVWMRRFEDQARTLRRKLLAVYQELEKLGSLYEENLAATLEIMASAPSELDVEVIHYDGGIAVRMNDLIGEMEDWAARNAPELDRLEAALMAQKQRVQEAYDKYLREHASFERQVKRYTESYTLPGMYVQGLIEKIRGAMPTKVDALTSKHSAELTKATWEAGLAAQDAVGRAENVVIATNALGWAVFLAELGTGGAIITQSAKAIGRAAAKEAFRQGAKQTMRAAAKKAVNKFLLAQAKTLIVVQGIGFAIPKVLELAGVDGFKIHAGLIAFQVLTLGNVGKPKIKPKLSDSQRVAAAMEAADTMKVKVTTANELPPRGTKQLELFDTGKPKTNTKQVEPPDTATGQITRSPKQRELFDDASAAPSKAGQAADSIVAPNSVKNWRGEPVRIPEGHIMSPRDPAMSAPPIVESGPFTTAQRNAMLAGESGGTRLSPHHRHQIPTTHGGVIDELPGPGHPSGNIHTAGSPSRHPSPSIFNSMEGGKALRQSEITSHWQAKGQRLIEVEPGVWIDPGF